MNQKLQQTVDKVKDAVNIVDVIGEFLTLKKAAIKPSARSITTRIPRSMSRR